MGCARSRPDSQETLLESKFVLTGFEAHSTNYTVSGILRYSRLSVPLTVNVLKAIRRHLGLHSHQPSEQLEQFYSDAFLGKSPRTLLVAGVLLSKGSSKTKAKALFEVYDSEAEGTLKASGVQELAHEMMNLAAKGLQVLYTDLSSADLQYFTEIQKNIVKGSQQVSKGLLCSSLAVSKTTFIERLSAMQSGSLLQTYGLRHLLYQLSSNHPKA